MNEIKERRAKKIASLKNSLSKVPIISKNISFISSKLEKNQDGMSSAELTPSSTTTRNP